MRRLSWIISIPLMVIAVVFAVVNRQSTQVNLWPFDFELQAPLFLVVLLAARGFTGTDHVDGKEHDEGRKRNLKRDERQDHDQKQDDK